MFRVQLDLFRGPLDLLFYLVRKHEIEITKIPLAPIAEQFLEYLEVLEAIDGDLAGEFIDIASQLLEMKARRVLPKVETPAESSEQAPIVEEQENLVERLLEYKRYRDAASVLEEKSRQWNRRRTRMVNDLPDRKKDLADQPLEEIELWDLVSAFGRILRDRDVPQPENIVYDEVPIQAHMQAIHQRLQSRRHSTFSELFTPGMHKASLVSAFLAILELTRHHGVRAEQSDEHGEILITPSENFNEDLDVSQADGYGAA